MNFARRRTRLSFLTLLILTLAFVAGTGGRFAASASGTPLQNPGFEAGAGNWTLAGPDAALVVGAEGAAQFSAYAAQPFGPITVNPNLGSKMARLGTPRTDASQAQGRNSASQTFTPTSSTYRFAARIFSVESRKNTDYVCFSFTLGASGSGAQGCGSSVAANNVGKVSASFNEGATSVVACSNVSPCSKPINGKDDSFDSGWVVVTVTDLPTNIPVTFTASVGSTENSSKPSWLYIDNVSTEPPVAAFDLLFPRVSLDGTIPPQPIPAGFGVGPLEGSPIQFRDLSTDPDQGDTIVAWEWMVDGLNAPLTTQNPFFVPDHDGPFTVTLTVTDSTGKVSVAKSTTIAVLNAPPLVNALNVEALAGKPFPVMGRFTDAGWNDTHTAVWGGVAPTAQSLEEDHAPALGTGKATGIAPAGSSGPASLTITDSEGAAKTDPFTINTLPNTLSLLNHTEFDSARTVTTDGSWLGLIPNSGARSVYEIKWPGTSGTPQAIPGGSEVLVNLKDLPADYDLVLVTVPDGAPPSAGYAFSGFAFSGYAFSELPNIVSPYAAGYAFSGTGTAGYAFSGVQRAAYGEAGYAFSGEEAAGYAFSGYAFSGYAFSGYAFSDAGSAGAFAPYAVAGYAFSPISQMGFTGLETSGTSPSDVALSELGLGAIPAGTSVVGYSANSGNTNETVLARIDQTGTRLYAIVVGANGAFSPETFRLDVEGSMTITAAALNADPGTAGKVTLTGGTCAPRFTGATAFTAFAGSSLALGKSNPTTLFVTQQERLQGLNPGPAASWNSFVTDVHALANRSDVNGKIISIPASTYSAWDTTPCSIDEANAASDAVRDAIQAELTANPTIQYVVFLGDDDVIPFRRVPDQVSIGNERSYLTSSFLKQGTPLYASVAGGYNLTDDCNVDANPTPWQGRELCIPDRVVARMVETPAEIAGQARAFGTANGLLAPMTAANPNLVTGYDFFADGSQAVVLALQGLNAIFSLVNETWTATDLRCKLLGQGVGCTVPVIADANAHYTHYAALSANGFNTGDYDDALTSTNVQTAANVGTLVGRLFFTIGCHAGFSAPDNAIADIDPALGLDGKLDFPQAFAQARAVWVGSTGYGIGDDSGISGTEGILVNYAKELAKGKTAGKALIAAKRSYLAALPAASVYDEKSSINLTLYGLPMYSLAGVAVSPLTAAVEDLTIDPGVPENFPVALNTIAQGSYYSALNGDAAAPPYRPLQPRQAIPVGNAGLDPVHGILWLSGGFTDTPNFNPVISRPTVEWELNPTEPQVCYDNFWPSEIFRVNTLDGPTGPEQTVVVTPGQFRCDGLDGGQVRGTQRIFTILGWEMLRSFSTDVTPPSLTNLEIGSAAGGLVLNIDALDPAVTGAPTSGVARIVVLRTGSTSVTMIADQAVGPVASGSFSVPIPNPGNDRIVIQVVDDAGNVGYYTAKGPGIQILTVNLGPDTSAFVNTPVSFTASVSPAVPASDTATYSWDFGDGTTDVTSTNATSHTFSAVALRNVTVQVTTSNGGIGADTVVVDVTNPVVEVDLGTDRQELLNTSVSFAANVSPALALGVTATYTWDFGGEATTTTSSPTTSHTFGSVGSKTVTVQVLASNGAVGDDTVIIHVFKPVVTVELGPDKTALVNTSVSFTAAATITPAVVSPATVSYAWNFGDGTPTVTTSTNTTSHTFATAGAKTVTVQVTTTPTGGSGSDSLIVTVTNPVVTIKATSIVCPSVSLLPGFPFAGRPINASTVANFLATHPTCRTETGWDFQWGYDGTVSKLGGSTIGYAPGSGWKAFTEGASDTYRVAYAPSGGTIWVREVLKAGYLRFTDATSFSSNSARFGCHLDAVNYDNYDRISGATVGQTYYCVAWNVKP